MFGRSGSRVLRWSSGARANGRDAVAVAASAHGSVRSTERWSRRDARRTAVRRAEDIARLLIPLACGRAHCPAPAAPRARGRRRHSSACGLTEVSRAADRTGPLAVHAVAVVVLGAAVAWRRPLPLLATLVAAGTVVVQAALGVGRIRRPTGAVPPPGAPGRYSPEPPGQGRWAGGSGCRIRVRPAPRSEHGDLRRGAAEPGPVRSGGRCGHRRPAADCGCRVGGGRGPVGPGGTGATGSGGAGTRAHPRRARAARRRDPQPQRRRRPGGRSAAGLAAGAGRAAGRDRGHRAQRPGRDAPPARSPPRRARRGPEPAAGPRPAVRAGRAPPGCRSGGPGRRHRQHPTAASRSGSHRLPGGAGVRDERLEPCRRAGGDGGLGLAARPSRRHGHGRRGSRRSIGPSGRWTGAAGPGRAGRPLRRISPARAAPRGGYEVRAELPMADALDRSAP